MSGLTGYLTINAIDLSSVFMPLLRGSPYPLPTGYLLSNGKDLTSIFAANSNATILYNTGLLTSGGTDLTNIFNDINGIDYVTPTIGGTGAYSINVVGSAYTITFTGGTNTISFDKSITDMIVIVVGGGGAGHNGGSTQSSGGGASGGQGGWTFNYASGDIYDISAAVAVTANSVPGLPSKFLLGTTGITSTGGAAGLNSGNADAGTSTLSGSSGTLITATSGKGGTATSGNGSASLSFTILGISYKYGGGGGGGGISNGGNAGLNGTGGTGGGNNAIVGQNASSYGSGGGGGSKTASAGGDGGPGLVLIRFKYPPFSPLSITGCSLWMDANDTSSMSLISSTSLNSWTDKSPNRFVFTSGTNKPTLSTNSQNSKSTISFTSASSNYLQGDNNATNFTIGLNSYALFAVFKITSGNAGIYNKSLYGVGVNRILMVKDVSLNLSFVHTDNIKLATSTNTITTYQLVCMTVNRKTDNKDTSYGNGTQNSTLSYAADTTNYIANTNVMLIGAYNNVEGTGPYSGYYLQGNIAEIISYTNPYDMTTTTRQTIEGYLAWKWGIQLNLPMDHPYYGTPP